MILGWLLGLVLGGVLAVVALVCWSRAEGKTIPLGTALIISVLSILVNNLSWRACFEHPIQSLPLIFVLPVVAQALLSVAIAIHLGRSWLRA